MEQLIEIISALFAQIAIWFQALIEWIMGLVGTL
jgi:hypothetical protein